MVGSYTDDPDWPLEHGCVHFRKQSIIVSDMPLHRHISNQCRPDPAGIPISDISIFIRALRPTYIFEYDAIRTTSIAKEGEGAERYSKAMTPLSANGIRIRPHFGIGSPIITACDQDLQRKNQLERPSYLKDLCQNAGNQLFDRMNTRIILLSCTMTPLLVSGQALDPLAIPPGLGYGHLPTRGW